MPLSLNMNNPEQQKLTHDNGEASMDECRAKEHERAGLTDFTIAKDAELHSLFYNTKFSLVVGSHAAAFI